MKTIEPNGPYNIIAISWGGCLAIETTQILEEAEAKTNLCFLDAAPDTIQTALGHLNESPGFEVNLITKILNISDKEVKIAPSPQDRKQVILGYSTPARPSKLDVAAKVRQRPQPPVCNALWPVSGSVFGFEKLHQ